MGSGLVALWMRQRYRLIDKIGALQLIGKHCGYLTESNESNSAESRTVDEIRQELTARITRLIKSQQCQVINAEPGPAATGGAEAHVEFLGETGTIEAEG